MAQPKPQTFLIGGLLYTLLFAAAAESIGGSDSDNKCGGEERWNVKVVTDPNADKASSGFEETTIADLTKIDTKKPENKYGENKPRMEIETHLYKIRHCLITDVLREDDNDLHLVIEDGAGNHMIAEIPDPNCSEAQKSDWIGNFEEARNTLVQFSNNYRHFIFSITGFLFVDKKHGQTGRAPNNVELHPIIEIKKEKK